MSLANEAGSGKSACETLAMATGSIAGSFINGRSLRRIPSPVLLPLLAVILVLSAVKVWRHC
jgi:uncharacterized membrane protein YfcA